MYIILQCMRSKGNLHCTKVFKIFQEPTIYYNNIDQCQMKGWYKRSHGEYIQVLKLNTDLNGKVFKHVIRIWTKKVSTGQLLWDPKLKVAFKLKTFIVEWYMPDFAIIWRQFFLSIEIFSEPTGSFTKTTGIIYERFSDVPSFRTDLIFNVVARSIY